MNELPPLFNMAVTSNGGVVQRLQLPPARLAKILQRIAAGYSAHVLPQLIEGPVGRCISFYHMEDHLLGELPNFIGRSQAHTFHC